LQHKQSFSAEKGSRPAPAGVDREARIAGQIGTRLDEENLTVHLDGRDVAGGAWGETDFARTAAGREG
jgi:hypothetical protein